MAVEAKKNLPSRDELFITIPKSYSVSKMECLSFKFDAEGSVGSELTKTGNGITTKL